MAGGRWLASGARRHAPGFGPARQLARTTQASRSPPRWWVMALAITCGALVRRHRRYWQPAPPRRSCTRLCGNGTGAHDIDGHLARGDCQPRRGPNLPRRDSPRATGRCRSWSCRSSPWVGRLYPTHSSPSPCSVQRSDCAVAVNRCRAPAVPRRESMGGDCKGFRHSLVEIA